jgi:hypothetical protein
MCAVTIRGPGHRDGVTIQGRRHVRAIRVARISHRADTYD